MSNHTITAIGDSITWTGPGAAFPIMVSNGPGVELEVQRQNPANTSDWLPVCKIANGDSGWVYERTAGSYRAFARDRYGNGLTTIALKVHVDN